MSISRVEQYNPVDMSLTDSSITSLDFGGMVRGQHVALPAVIKPVVTGSVTQLALFLEDNGGNGHAAFGYLASKEVFCGIVGGDTRISDHFTEVNGVSDFTFLEDGVSLDPDDPEYVWLDVYMSTAATVGQATFNYRFVFEYV